MSSFDLSGRGKVALITGGAGGLGRATAEVFGEAGYRVALADIDAEAGRAAEAALGGQGVEAFFVETDVADNRQAAAAVAAVAERWGGLDFVLNNAGIVGLGKPIEEFDEADLDRVLAVNLKGPFNICQHAVGVQRRRGGGSILNVSSISAEAGSPFYAAYAASKAGVVALTRSLARVVGRFNIRVNCLRPGSIQGTELMGAERRAWDADRERQHALAMMRRIPLGRRAVPRDVAQLALFLASPLASHIHGAVLTIDGGESLGYSGGAPADGDQPDSR